MGTYIETANDKAPNMMPFVHFACNREHRFLNSTNPQSLHDSSGSVNIASLNPTNSPNQTSIQACCSVDFELTLTKHGIRCLPTSVHGKNNDRLSAAWCEPWPIHKASEVCVPPDRNLTSYRPVQTHDAQALDKVRLKVYLQ